MLHFLKIFSLIQSLHFICQGLAIKVQEQKRDEALSRLVPAAASVIRNWWRLRCVYHGDRYVQTWKIYTLIQRRVKTVSSSKDSPDSASAMVGSTVLNTRADRNPFRFSFTNPTPAAPPIKSGEIRRRSITCMEDLPKRYISAIKILRILKYSSSCKKFQEAKRPIDIKEVVRENTQMNNRLTMMLNDIQRRLDSVLGTSKPASFLPDEQKRQMSLTARIEKAEEKAYQFEEKLNYLEQLALSLIKNASTSK